MASNSAPLPASGNGNPATVAPNVGTDSAKPADPSNVVNVVEVTAAPPIQAGPYVAAPARAATIGAVDSKASATPAPLVEVDIGKGVNKKMAVAVEVGDGKPARAIASVPLVQDDLPDAPKPLKVATRKGTQPITFVELEPKALPPTPQPDLPEIPKPVRKTTRPATDPTPVLALSLIHI